MKKTWALTLCLFLLSLLANIYYLGQVPNQYKTVIVPTIKGQKINNNISRFEKVHSLNDIIWDGKKFIAVGEEGVVLSSRDGVAWKEDRLGKRYFLYEILYSDDRYILLGADYMGDKPIIFLSKDGQNWIKQEIETYLHEVIFNGQEFFALGGQILGDRRSLYTSSDGVKWSKINGTDNLTSDGTVWADKDKVILVGGPKDQVYTLKDENLVEHSMEPDKKDGTLISKWFTDAIETNGKFIAVGTINTSDENFNHYSHGVIVTSEDGRTWNKLILKLNSGLNKVIYGNEEFITVGDDGAILVSDNGANWRKVDLFRNTQQPYNSIAYNGHYYVAVGHMGIATTFTID